LRPGHSDNNEEHLQHLAGWLCRAQDATPDNGVARSYSITYRPFFKRKGWFESYPETTGYIIPTLFDYFHFTGEEDYRKRALRMADWECDVQMSNGAVMGGTVDFSPTPAVFNTGQVVFGWCRAYLESQEERYLDAARRAGNFLVGAQDPSGQWIMGTSKFAAEESTVYNTRVSWALALLDSIVNDGKYRQRAIRNIDWALSKQNKYGWFSDNCLDDPQQPLVHTIAYAIQGILETGIVLENKRYIQAAVTAAVAVANLIRADGSLAGRYDEQWRPTVTWSCLTGNAQMSIIWSRLHQTGIEQGLDSIATKSNEFSRSVQNLRTRSSGRNGGVKGAYPVYGGYGTFEYLNWAVKFLMDAFLLEEKSKGNARIRKAEDQGAPLFWGS
jgi:rhamnogalacturonyl hydrolase YesR